MVMRIEILSNEDMKKIHEASLDILEITGIRIDHKEALERLAAAGAKIDTQKRRVRFPADLVERSLAQVPRKICLAGRDPEYDHEISCDSDFLVRGGAGYTLVPRENGSGFRVATIKDQKEAGILCDGLGAIDFSGLMCIQDVAPKSADLHATKTLLENSRKHFMGLTMGSINMKYLAEMQLAVRGTKAAMIQRPLFHSIVCPISPLYYPQDEIERLKVCGENGLPVKVAVLPMLGVSAPVTIAGAITQGNAEVLGGFTLLQTLYPGLPTIYYCIPGVAEMRTGKAVGGGPENMLVYASLAQLGTSYYGMPTECPAFLCDGFIFEQLMFQRGMGACMAATSGAAILSGAGGIDRGMGTSLTQLAIDDEIVQIIRRIAAKFEVNDDKIGIDAVHRVGPGGNFIADEHTYKHFRDEIRFYPTVFDFSSYAEWIKDPRGIHARAQNRVSDILKNHEVPPLEGAVLRELERILKAADREIS
jgi:trimethylamine--corrinoid protein Co-methyltransferase